VATLIIDTGSGPDLEYEIHGEGISIGAAESNDVVLRVPGVAPNHLVIRRSGDRFTFLGQQRQVVLVNGKRRARGVFEEGDKIRIGTATLFVRDMATGLDDEDLVEEIPEVEEIPGASAEGIPAEPVRQRAEVVLFNEPTRLASARRQLLEIFRSGAQLEVAAAL